MTQRNESKDPVFKRQSLPFSGLFPADHVHDLACFRQQTWLPALLQTIVGLFIKTSKSKVVLAALQIFLNKARSKSSHKACPQFGKTGTIVVIGVLLSETG